MALTWRIQPRSFVYSSLCVGLLLCSLCVTSQSTPVPHGHACLPPNDGFPFCNVTLSVHERVADLIARLTYEDKIGALNDWQGSVDRIGLPDFNFENEGLHGLGGICFSVSNTSGVRCPTTFPIPPTLGASWNDTLLKAVGMAIGTEQRAYNNWGGMRNGGPRPVDLGIWLLNMNLARDARWGRNLETYSESPELVGALASAMIDGAQWGDRASPYMQVIAVAKHAAAYQVEDNRFARDAVISPYDLGETYFAAWKEVVANGVAGYMCSYNAINGVPMCGNRWFQTDIMRTEFGLGNATSGGSYCQADCGAIQSIGPGAMGNPGHGYVSDLTHAAATAMNAGTDMECFGGYDGSLEDAITANYTNVSVVDASLARTYTLQFLAGRFDPLDNQPLTRIPFEAIDSPQHRALAYDAALQGMVLLRNDNGVLPLVAGVQSIAVVGPMGNLTDSLMGNYFQQRCAANPAAYDCVPTIVAALSSANGGAAVSFTQGVNLNDGDTSGIPAAVAAASAADVVVLAIGMDQSVANEGKDRADARLPGEQLTLALSVLRLHRPATIILLLNGAALAIDEIVGWTGTNLIAIVEAFLPGQAGGDPIAAHIFGRANRWGKLPITMMPANYTSQIPIDDMNMTAGPGRTYKYFTGEPLYPMGYGLSYTRFTLHGNCSSTNYSDTVATNGHFPPLLYIASHDIVSCSLNVTNVGERDGDEVVQLYVEPNATTINQYLSGTAVAPVVLRRLLAWRRVSIAAGKSVTVNFSIPQADLYSTDEAGARIV